MDQVPNPSGSFLPLLLRQKCAGDEKNVEGAAQSHPELTKTEAAVLSDRIFTTQDIEERIRKTTLAMVEIQKQIFRGEEIYYEDTYSHGNLHRGWDAFVDAKDVGPASNPQPKRVPGDFRWFSGSCRSVSRNAKPTPLTRSLPSSNAGRQNSNNTPTNFYSSIRSETNTPTPSLVADASRESTATPSQENLDASKDAENPKIQAMEVDEPTPSKNETNKDSAAAKSDEKTEVKKPPNVDTTAEIELENSTESNNKRQAETDSASEKPPAKKANKGTRVEQAPTETKEKSTTRNATIASSDDEAPVVSKEKEDAGAADAPLDTEVEYDAGEKDTEKSKNKVDDEETSITSKKARTSPTTGPINDVSKKKEGSKKEEEGAKKEDPQTQRPRRSRRTSGA